MSRQWERLRRISEPQTSIVFVLSVQTYVRREHAKQTLGSLLEAVSFLLPGHVFPTGSEEI
jgi:hypothetical protein